MGIENAQTIAGLDATWPTGSDPTNEGDDHVRTIKRVLQLTMPGVGGGGWAKPITATEDQLNFVTGATSNIQAQLDTLTGQVGGVPGTLYAPPGTRMLFHQESAPLGWTIDPSFTSHQIVASLPSEAGNVYGTDDPTNYVHAHGTALHTLTQHELPTHHHNMQAYNDAVGGRLSYVTSPHQQRFRDPALNGGGQESFNNGDTMETGGDGAHDHGNTLTAQYTPRSTGVVIASKD